MSFSVHDPRGRRVAATAELARRPASLRGLKLGVLDNGKEQADVLLGRAAQLLAAEGAQPNLATKPSFSRVAPDDVIERLGQYDLAITGLGG